MQQHRHRQIFNNRIRQISEHMSSQKLSALVVGATRGLGASLAKKYATKGYTVYGTARGSSLEDSSPSSVQWIKDVDISTESAGQTIVKGIGNAVPKLDVVVVAAGLLAKESLDEPDFEKQVMMYKICAIGPVFIVHHLWKGGLLGKGTKVVFISSEAGSITLRDPSEGGGMYGHHASKTALNMNGKLLSLDLKEPGVAVGMIHPGFMRTEMTKGAGFDKFWDEAGAVTPDEAAGYITDWIDGFGMDRTGTFWAPRGPIDIGTIEQTVGPKDKLSTPLQLPW